MWPLSKTRDGVVENPQPVQPRRSLTLTFTPVSGGTPRYRYGVSGLGYDSSAATLGSPVAALGDDDSRQFTLPFAFPFYGAAYTQVFLNSDGNLTFTAADSASTSRSVGRMTGGPPRISPLFDDLGFVRSAGGVRFFADASHVVFSWVNVPEYSWIPASGGADIPGAPLCGWQHSVLLFRRPSRQRRGRDRSRVRASRYRSPLLSQRCLGGIPRGRGGALRQHTGNRYRHPRAEVLRDARGRLRLSGDLQQHGNRRDGRRPGL